MCVVHLWRFDARTRPQRQRAEQVSATAYMKMMMIGLFNLHQIQELFNEYTMLIYNRETVASFQPIVLCNTPFHEQEYGKTIGSK